MFADLVLKRERELYQRGIQELRDSLESPDTLLKVENYADRYGFSTEEIFEKIKNDDLVASFFAKNPSKQNFTEKLVSELLGVKTLPQQGKNCIRFREDGEICSTKTSGTTKSADFFIGSTYITQKYTRSSGGAQDNQYADVVDFLTKGSKKQKVAAIVDGSYWDNGKRLELKKYFSNNPNVKILSMDDILNGGILF